MTVRIEIQEQPERNRFFSEVEIGGLTARRDLVTSPRTGDLLADLEAHWSAIRAALRIMRPDLAEAKGQEKHEEVDALDDLRAEAEAAGIKVDRRWGEARLRQEIAAAHASAGPE